MTPGIYPGLGRAEYDAIKAVNQSTLKQFRRSPAHAKHYLDHGREETSDLSFGTAVHAALLEPKRFQAEYIALPKYDMRKTADKAAASAFIAANEGKTIIDGDDYQRCQKIIEAIRYNATASELLSLPGPNEVAVVWNDPDTGLLCKALLDRIVSYRGITTVVDPKTTKNAAERSFTYDCLKFGYHLQAAFYLDGLQANEPADRMFLFLAIEKEPPYASAVYELDYLSLEAGRDQCRRYLQQYADCLKTGFWPSYPDTIQTLQLPQWGRSDDE